jgi:hypothetical protein
MFFRFPPDARWNSERAAVEFGIGVGEYEGVVRVSRRVFQSLLEQTPDTRTTSRSLPSATHSARIDLGAEGASPPTH